VSARLRPAGQRDNPPACGPDDPPHIHRADLLAALDSIAITDPMNVARVVITPDAVEVTRWSTPRRVDLLTGDAVTATTRIEIR
jgi:hypothetical protein